MKITNTDWTTKKIQIKDRTKNKYNLPTELAMRRLLAKMMK